jgi:[acyl-carrier-protein] S-malonyltransferase
LPDNLLAFVFPAFPDDFKKHPASGIEGFDDLFRSLLRDAPTTRDAVNLPDPDFTSNIHDSLTLQYLTFVYSCAASSILNSSGIAPSLVAGYSMGIYAALVQAGSIRFSTGLELIRLAYQTIADINPGVNYRMGTIIGLDRVDLIHLIENHKLQAEITNQNASHSFVVSGTENDVIQLLKLAKEEGALHTRELLADQPYHHSFLAQAASNFAREIGNIDIEFPKIRVISLIDQRVLTSSDEIRLEVIRNLYQPLNWFETQKTLIRMGISQFIECGASRGLMKNAKFIPGNFQFFALDSIASGIK